MLHTLAAWVRPSRALIAVGSDASVNGAPISFSDAMMCARRVGGSAVHAMFIVVVEVVSAVECIKKKFTHVLCAAWQKKGGVVCRSGKKSGSEILAHA